MGVNLFTSISLSDRYRAFLFVGFEMAKKINKVKRLRFELQLKQSELAKLMDCDQSLIAKIETGAAGLSPDKAARLEKIIKESLNG